MPGRAVARISASDSNGCAATSPAPRVAHERLTHTGAGDVVLQLKSVWRDGTTHIKMLPLKFMQRLAALVPRPRLHLIRFRGVLAPHARLRAAIVPGAAGIDIDLTLSLSSTHQPCPLFPRSQKPVD